MNNMFNGLNMLGSARGKRGTITRQKVLKQRFGAHSKGMHSIGSRSLGQMQTSVGPVHQKFLEWRRPDARGAGNLRPCQNLSLSVLRFQPWGCSCTGGQGLGMKKSGAAGAHNDVWLAFLPKSHAFCRLVVSRAKAREGSLVLVPTEASAATWHRLCKASLLRAQFVERFRRWEKISC